MPMSCRRMSGSLLGFVVGRNDLHKNLLQILLLVALPEIRERALGEEFAGLDDADDVAEFFDFAHDVGGEGPGVAALAALADEVDDGEGGYGVQGEGGRVENHHLRRVEQGEGD